MDNKCALLIFQSTGLLQQMRFCKKVMVEPRRGHQDDFDQMMKDFYTIIQHQEMGKTFSNM